MDIIQAKQKLQSLLQNNKYEKARIICSKLCKKIPNDVELWLTYAGIHAQLGLLTKVAECCEKVIKLQPNNVMAHYNLGIAYNSTGQFELAEKSFQNSLQLNPLMHGASIALGQVIMKRGRVDEAIALYTRLLSGPAGNNQEIVQLANINLSLALNTQKRFIEAEEACNRVLAINPNSTEALNNLGQTLKEQGNLDAAADAHRRAINIRPEFVVAHSNLLLDLNYLTNIAVEDVFAEHCRWGQQHGTVSSLKKKLKNDLNPDRPIRVGYVSPDFRAHSVILFIAGLIEAHNRQNVEVFCYSNVKNPDAWTSRVSEAADHWRVICNINDDSFADMVRDDKIDILIDLAGHTSSNRLQAFASKPAPIQVTWLGYPNTTGLNTIDYRITDTWADPPGISDDLNIETLVRLPQGFLCFQPLHDSPAVNKLPMSVTSNITFGCFNNSAKINNEVIQLWAKLLLEIPDSRLLLKSQQLSEPALKKRYLLDFEQAGINPNRIEIIGSIASTIEHLSLYNRMDVALDPFPYNGTTTTCEALWMGVPVITLEGNNHAARVGVSLLNNAGLPEFVAKTKGDYLRIASELAKKPDQLVDLRNNMREHLLNTPLLNAQNFAENIEDAYRSMWLKYCQQ
ncbi:TPR domain protein, putative component of TonB system [hydrothermal vent metagenome]|uniref:protein O-GlcNAc transferase n=1 Tax=hydrothermal vent metagenome TaxID=652676 RepID=A0A3B0WHW0_9ZZZZ